MRLYGMYYICKNYIEKVEKMKAKSKSTVSGTVYYIDGWRENILVLDALARIKPLMERAQMIYETIPMFYRDKGQFDVTETIKNSYERARKDLIVSMQTIIDAYEVLGIKETDAGTYGFDVKLPEFTDIGEFSKCLADLNFILTQCPYLQKEDSSIKYSSVDVGSTWLTFVTVGGSAGALLVTLTKLVDAAVKVKSHVVTVRQQEEELRAMQLKNNLSVEMMETFRTVNKTILDNCIGDVKRELGELKDGEEDGKADKSIERLAYWMDRGLQIYSAIDAPAEIKDLFPKQEETVLLTDDIQKLIEMKQDNK